MVWCRGLLGCGLGEVPSLDNCGSIETVVEMAASVRESFGSAKVLMGVAVFDFWFVGSLFCGSGPGLDYGSQFEWDILMAVGEMWFYATRGDTVQFGKDGSGYDWNF